MHHLRETSWFPPGKARPTWNCVAPVGGRLPGARQNRPFIVAAARHTLRYCGHHIGAVAGCLRPAREFHGTRSARRRSAHVTGCHMTGDKFRARADEYIEAARSAADPERK